MKKSFAELYKAFEDRFRGPRELVKERQKIYLPLLSRLPVKEDTPNLAIDLGCGRGEWLEILTEAGLDAVGVDVNEGMAQEAVERGLKIELQDAVEYLKGQPDDGAAVISAFHMVEHVATDYLIELLDECRRVLADGGLLILETPNPENISVGTHTFYLDPTHKSPLPPSLLEFLVEQAGFGETAILRLNGESMIEAGPMERSIHLMFEVARDYACLARKHDKQAAGEPNSLAAFVETASQQMPANMEKVKGWFRSADDEIVNISEEVKGTASSRAHQLEQLTDNLAAQSELLRTGNKALTDTVASLGKQLEDIIKARVVAARDIEIDRLRQRIADIDTATTKQLADKQAAIEERDVEIARLASNALENAEAIAILTHDLSIEKSRSHEWWLRSENLQKQIEELYKSRSWKLTGPYRRTGRTLKRAVTGFGLRGHLKSKRDSFAILAIHFVLRRPQLKALLSKQLRRCPALFNRFRDFAIATHSSNYRKHDTFLSYPDFSRSYSYRLNENNNIDERILNSSSANRIFLDLEQSSTKRRET